jgi:8-oxo-dGTP pyrophosphatase MutT (NUDIX family)
MKLDISALKQLVSNASVPGPPQTGTYKSACVFLLLFNPEDLHLLAIQKTDSEGYPWRNQVALPGGHLDDDDASALEGAFRELEEEVSIRPDEVELFGSLGHFQTINQRDIEVFAGLWHGTGPVRWEPAEISRVLEIPLRSLVATHVTGNFHGCTPDVQQLRYPYEDVVIWGATARILHAFIELIYPLLKSADPNVV